MAIFIAIFRHLKHVIERCTVLATEWRFYNKPLKIDGIDCHLLNHMRQTEKNRNENRQCERAFTCIKIRVLLIFAQL